MKDISENRNTTDECTISICDQQSRRMTRVTKSPKYLDKLYGTQYKGNKMQDKVSMTDEEAMF